VHAGDELGGPAGQTFPHALQLFGSDAGLEHLHEQQLLPVVHAKPTPSQLLMLHE
jgi:hypothetical protein